MKFELWSEEFPEVVCYTLVPANALGNANRASLDDTARVIFTLEALNYVEAMNQYYAHMQWGDYTPIDAELDSILFSQRPDWQVKED